MPIAVDEGDCNVLRKNCNGEYRKRLTLRCNGPRLYSVPKSGSQRREMR
jgi:hypothetical protein